jgi:hypothetical protein
MIRAIQGVGAYLLPPFDDAGIPGAGKGKLDPFGVSALV